MSATQTSPCFSLFFVVIFMFRKWETHSYNVINCKLTLPLLNTICPALANSIDPDQLAFEEVN